VADGDGARVAFAEADHRQVASDELLALSVIRAEHRIDVERRR